MFAVEYPAVVRTVYLVLHDYSRSEEIAQDAFVQLLRHWNKVRRYEAPGAWVRRGGTAGVARPYEAPGAGVRRAPIRPAPREAEREHRRTVLARKRSSKIGWNRRQPQRS